MPPGAIRSRGKILDELFDQGMAGIAPEDALFAMMRNSSNAREMNVDGSAVPVSFGFTNNFGEELKLNRLNLYYVMQSNPSGRGFGTSNNPLPNGLLIRILNTDGTTVRKDFLDAEGITRNGDFYLLAGVDATPQRDSNQVAVRWTLSKTGSTITLQNEERFEIVVRDDLAAGAFSLLIFRAMVQGFLDR